MMRNSLKSRNYLEKKAQEILRFLEIKGAECRVYLVSNKDMENIRKKLITLPQFKGKEAKKIRQEACINVLSFKEPAFPHPESKKELLGEVYINKDWSAPGAKKRADRVHLLIHGILHLVGYIHYTKRDTIRMENKERLLWHHVSSSD